MDIDTAKTTNDVDRRIEPHVHRTLAVPKLSHISTSIFLFIVLDLDVPHTNTYASISPSHSDTLSMIRFRFSSCTQRFHDTHNRGKKKELVTKKLHDYNRNYFLWRFFSFFSFCFIFSAPRKTVRSTVLREPILIYIVIFSPFICSTHIGYKKS